MNFQAETMTPQAELEERLPDLVQSREVCLAFEQHFRTSIPVRRIKFAAKMARTSEEPPKMVC